MTSANLEVIFSASLSDNEIIRQIVQFIATQFLTALFHFSLYYLHHHRLRHLHFHRLAADVLKQEQVCHPGIEPLLIVLTDGTGNVSIGALPPQEESYEFAELIANEKIKSIVIDMEHAAFDQRLAQQLANHLNAPCCALSELKAESLP